MVSVIIRTRNEERWITPCLKAVHQQVGPDFEIVLVDNESTDRTVQKAKQVGIDRVVHIDGDAYRPGLALNEGIRASSGALIACLSGHCIPVDQHWLERLAANFDCDEVAGVYGRQEPLASTSNQDKRDMLIVFGLDRRVQRKDSFFHNANSMIRRSFWEEVNFDESVEHIEDRIWAREMLSRDRIIVYEPGASVYHYHGIHHGGDEDRAHGVVRILERLEADRGNTDSLIDPELLDIVALIPIRGPVQQLGGRPVLEYTVEAALRSERVNRVVVSTEDTDIARVAESMGASVPFMRDPLLSEDYVDLETVIEHALADLEEAGAFVDLLVTLEATFPFRPSGLIDELVDRCLREGLDTVIAGTRESGGIFRSENGHIEPLSTGLTPRKYRTPDFVGLKGVGCVTHPEYARAGSLFGDVIGIYEVDDPLAAFEVRDPVQFEIAEVLVDFWERRRTGRSDSGACSAGSEDNRAHYA